MFVEHGYHLDAYFEKGVCAITCLHNSFEKIPLCLQFINLLKKTKRQSNQKNSHFIDHCGEYDH